MTAAALGVWVEPVLNETIAPIKRIFRLLLGKIRDLVQSQIAREPCGDVAG
jgi:hypothetical protein